MTIGDWTIYGFMNMKFNEEYLKPGMNSGSNTEPDVRQAKAMQEYCQKSLATFDNLLATFDSLLEQPKGVMTR